MSEWIVFDYGEVICGRTDALPRLAATLGVDVAEFEPHYWAFRDRYDRGGPDLEYWGAIGEELGVAVDESTSDTLTRIDIEGWSRVDPASLELIGALAESGAALALLSNAPSSFARFAERQDWARHFRVRVFSGDEGVAKPDREIFERLLARLGAQAGECVFFDDRQSNVDGARAAGLRAHLWQGVETAVKAGAWVPSGP
ncbi:putative hydrolase of the HAD superfamily [Amycolatopsis bartoniae]|uniref:Haloacid dehalogenase n=1 Tax=Amycolatopsis bartoniae TaxID=941986 RepID=A0A8H9IW72_9PSEU|nr:HAD family phosphatase [Amycolatopsis bartoniae]MBB2933048.1 putative hydrolase of the HAD superfamily [Amycolatopsis bartoniae]TVT11938.1 HAD family phosphatase [Amycolatopsis bartoniae]GHF56662.1 haloacid dehalogenase [Amycolatopsis bartoniae]